MSFLSNLFGKSKKNLPGNLSPSTPTENPLPLQARGGTTLRKADETPSVKKAGPELSALEMAARQSWEVKSLPVWKPGDEILGLYRVGEVIETGGMGRVYIAHHKGWNVKLAIKSPNEMMLSDRNNFARVLREANSWTELGLHPNIAYCYYVRSIEDVPHIFVEYVDGGNLRQWIAEGKCIDYRVSLDLAIQFCHGMEHAHSKGMIHRDIKPENVLMTKDGVLKITDFGLVRAGAVIDDGKGTAGASGKSMTRLGDVMGTEGFMAPEQFTYAAGVDERADIFSFGVCLYEMCCGARPYDITIGERKDAPDPISLSRDEKFPPALAEMLIKCVQWERDKRYESFKEIRERLSVNYLHLYDRESPYSELELAGLVADDLNNRGVSYFDLGRKEDALSCWEQALKQSPLHLEATYNFSVIQWREAWVDDLEVLKHLENCRNNPSLDKLKLAELKSFVHAERFDIKKAREVLRRFPGRYEALYSRMETSEIECARTLEGHTYRVDSVAITPDGWFAVSSSGYILRVWEIASGKCVRVINTDKSHTEMVCSVAITPDGQFVVSGSADKTIRFWKLASGKRFRPLEGHTQRVNSVALTADGRYAVSASDDNTLRVWNLRNWKCIRMLSGHTSVCSVALTPDDRFAVSGSRDNSLRVWDLATSQGVRTMEGHEGAAFSVALTPDGQFVVSGSADKTIRVWNFATGRCIRTMEGHSDNINSVALTPGGQFVVSGSADKTIRVWNFATGRCIRTMEGHSDSINSVALTPDGQFVVSGSADKTLRVWNICLDKVCQAEISVSLPKGFMERKAEEDSFKQAIRQSDIFFKEGNYRNSFPILWEAWKASGFSRTAIINERYPAYRKIGRTYDLSFTFLKQTLRGHLDGVHAVAVNSEGGYAISCGHDNTLRVWELASGRCVHTLEGHKGRVSSVAFTPHGYAVSSSWDTLRLWDLASGRCVRILGEGNDIGIAIQVAITPDSRYAVSCTDWGTLGVWELETGQCVRVLKKGPYKNRIFSIAITPDGLYAVSGDEEGIRVWDLVGNQPIRTIKEHTNPVNTVALTPDGRYIVSGSVDKTLRVWDLASGRCVKTLKGHKASVESVAVTSDGLYAISGSQDTTLRVWELASGRCIRTLEGHTNRVNTVALTPDGLYAVSGSSDKTLRIWEFIWDPEFPDTVDWDEGVRPYLEIFLALRKYKWGEEDFKILIDELASKRGYGWVRPEGVRKELEKMTGVYRN
jgi:WD40 repeat protein